GAFQVAILPKVGSVVINGGAAQRSRVTQLQVNFDSIVTLPANPADAFQLNRQSDNASVTLSASVTTDTVTHVTLTFTGGAIDGPGAPFVAPFSLADGRVTLRVLAAQVTLFGAHLDGAVNGVGGDDYVLVGDPPTNKLHRQFGDIDGDGDTDVFDFLVFRPSFGHMSPDPAYNPVCDYDNDG